MNYEQIPSEQENNQTAVPGTLYLTPENCSFSMSEEGFLTCTIDGNKLDHVVVVRALPFSLPEEFLSVLKEDEEQGMIRRLSDFDPKTMELLRKQLDFRYFTPQITQIHSIEENVSFLFFKLETTSGPKEICVTDIAKNLVLIDDDRVFLTDVEENRFIIPSIKALDKQSRQKIEIYI